MASYANMAAKQGVTGVPAPEYTVTQINPTATGLTRGEKTLLLGAIGGAAAVGTAATAMTAQPGSKKEAVAGGAAKGGLSLAMTGAALGSVAGPAGAVVGRTACGWSYWWYESLKGLYHWQESREST